MGPGDAGWRRVGDKFASDVDAVAHADHFLRNDTYMVSNGIPSIERTFLDDRTMSINFV